MDQKLKIAIVKGYERICAWSDLLDEINVFPVADGDTGRNLRISLSPVRTLDSDTGRMTEKILGTATGNAGNIAAAFFSRLFSAETVQDLPEAVKRGRDNAWASIAEPKDGTMLTLFDCLDLKMQGVAGDDPGKRLPAILRDLEETVRSTSVMLPELRAADVVDAGALGMFIFFEGFLRSIVGNRDDHIQIARLFGDQLKVSGKPGHGDSAGFCINTTLSPGAALPEINGKIKSLGQSVVTVKGEDEIRIHLHADDMDAVKENLSGLGKLKGWRAEKMSASIIKNKAYEKKGRVHIMTDAAGSITRQDAAALGITLLDSYLVIGDSSFPETLYDAGKLYHAMTKGVPVSTAQASLFERHQCYQSARERFDQTLYLTVGSFYTGNYKVAQSWCRKRDPEKKFHVMDTGAASGRLGLIAGIAARYAALDRSMEKVIRYTRKAIKASDELIFLDQLKYLAAGGRISKTSGFFGDLLRFKPIISPQADGAKKVGMVRKTKDQLPFALEYLKKRLPRTALIMVLLQYSDNRERVEGEIKKGISNHFPGAKIQVKPLSITSGAHMGPGTWGIAFCPDMSME